MELLHPNNASCLISEEIFDKSNLIKFSEDHLWYLKFQKVNTISY